MEEAVDAAPPSKRDPLIYAQQLERKVESELDQEMQQLQKGEEFVASQQKKIGKLKAELTLVRERIGAMVGRIKGRQLSALKRKPKVRTAADDLLGEQEVRAAVPARAGPHPLAAMLYDADEDGVEEIVEEGEDEEPPPEPLEAEDPGVAEEPVPRDDVGGLRARIRALTRRAREDRIPLPPP